MCETGHAGSPYNIVRLLKVCTATKDVHKGSKLHEYVKEHNYLETNTHIANTLVSMYAKCNALAKAHQVLKELPLRNVVSWNALISAYAQHGRGEEAMKCFDDMLCDGHSPDEVTFIGVLKACRSIGAVTKGKEIHDKIASLGMLEKDILLGSTLVDMYAKCGDLAKAHQVLKELPMHNVFSWSALIAGYAQHGQGEQALKCFDDMLHDGHFPNAITYISVLKACGSIEAVVRGEEIHGKIVNLGMLEKNVVLGNRLVDMYVKCGEFAKADRVLKELPMRDVVTWSTLIGGYAQYGQGEEALKCFDDMLRDGYSPNEITFICVLRACGSIGALIKGEAIHDKIVSLGMLEKDILLGSTLVDMYAKCSEFAKAHRVLKELPMCDVISWSALIAGYAQHGQGEEALKCFDDMLHDGHSPDAVTFICVLKGCGNVGAAAKGEGIHDKIVSLGMLDKNVVLGNTLVDMYAKCGEFVKAHLVLKEHPMRDAVSWNALIAGYAQHGQGEEALKCFDNMLHDGQSPNAITYICVLKSCGSIGAAAKGEEIHDKIVSLDMLKKDAVLGNILVDMFAKCGELAKAHQVLKEFSIHDVVCWSALIAGHAQQGQTVEAINCFEQMQSNGAKPDLISLSIVLHACSHVGLLDQAESYFLGMSRKYGICPSLEYYCCMIDVFGRAGRFDEALSLIAEMPTECLPCWIALLGACRKWSEVRIGTLAFKHVLILDKHNAAAYVLMADMCTEVGMQKRSTCC